VSPNDASQTGVTTSDGWTIAIERFLVGIGDASVGDACIGYSDAGYQRLLDARRPDDQKLSLLFGLGQCDLDFRVGGPASDTILGAGVSETDALLQGLKGTDAYVSQPSSVAVGLTATATRGASTLRLDWSFRQRIRYRNCEIPVDGVPAQPLDFPSNANITFHIVMHPEVLWRDGIAPDSSLRFDPIAAADTVSGNGDGEITLDELGRIPLVDLRKTGPYGTVGVDPATIPLLHSLEDYVYLVLAPAIPQFRESVLCKPNPRMMFD
jgi:hypothetical protein